MNYHNDVLKINGSELYSLIELMENNDSTLLLLLLRKAEREYPYILDSKSKITMEIGSMYDCKYTYMPSKVGCKYDRKTN